MAKKLPKPKSKKAKAAFTVPSTTAKESKGRSGSVKKKDAKPSDASRFPTTNPLEVAAPWEARHPFPGAEELEVIEDEEKRFAHVNIRTRVSRSLFVVEYLKDFNATNAILRMGVQGLHKLKTDPTQLGCLWLKEDYTQFLLFRFVQRKEMAAICTHQTVIAGLLEEAKNASDPKSRVAAYATLGRFLGMDQKKATGGGPNGSEEEQEESGVMLVPSHGSAADWEKQAMAAQEDLKKRARSNAA